MGQPPERVSHKSPFPYPWRLSQLLAAQVRGDDVRPRHGRSDVRVAARYVDRYYGDDLRPTPTRVRPKLPPERGCPGTWYRLKQHACSSAVEVAPVARSDTTCNGCGRRRPTSKEHLLHVAVAQVLLKDRSISTGRERDAALRRDPFFKGLKLYRNPLAGNPERPIYLDVYIENLICESCNRTWARLLEEEAGPNLYQFIHLHRPAQGVGAGSALLPDNGGMPGSG